MQIFISYASEQRDKAEPIALALRARGHEVFFDRDDLQHGVEYDQRIETAIKASDLMVFLISPQSVSPGRYTLTELEFARQHWRNPSRRVLPVKIAPTDMTMVPAYLRAVNIIDPKGSPTAETAAAVDQLRGLEYSLKVAAMLGLVGLVCGLLSWFSYGPDGLARLDTKQFGLSFRIPAPEIGFLFGLPIAIGAWVWGQQRWWAFAIPFVVLAICYWISAPTISELTYQSRPGGPKDPNRQKTELVLIVEKVKVSAPGVLTEDQVQFLTKVNSKAIEDNVKYERIVAAWLIELVLSVGTMASLALLLPAFRSVFRWLVVGAVGAAVSSAVTLFVLEGSTDFARWKAVTLMTLWLVVFSALVGYWLARGRTTVAG